ncbi:MAG: 4Fe-4S dicluster domain-containing protein, partial [Flavobacteriaceae bacterium]|nr:4Fe-4S dicluster domain-containing protein [Flavobacteriaceae bacterium]
MEDNNKNSRRKFLDKGLKLGLVTAIGGIGLSKITSRLNAKTENSSNHKMELMTTDGTLIQVDSSEVMEVEHSQDDNTKYNIREGMPNRKFVMVIDLAKCKNALKCVSACNKHHYITGENAWLKVHKMQESKDTAPYWMP